MLKYIAISTFVLFSLLSSTVLAQNSDRTIMSVSAKIVKGVSVESPVESKVILSGKEASNLGNLTLRGADNEQALISVSKRISLQDQNGNKIELGIKSKLSDRSDSVTNIALQVQSDKEIKSGFYRGELSTTIEYL